MKNLFLVLTLVFSSYVFGQTKIKTNDLIGYWKPDIESTQLFFWKDTKGNLQMQEISGTSGQPLDILELRVDKNSVFVKTKFIPNNHITDCTLSLKDENTLICIVSGYEDTAITYKKIK
jgi:hypothetical protein